MLKPDLFPDLPWGLRRHLDRTKPFWFLVSESLLKNEKPVPRKMHHTVKWGDVEVIDYSQVEQPSKPNVFKLGDTSLYLYTLNLLFRYALGIPDQADRNFMLMNDGIVYAVDEEALDRPIDFKKSLREKKASFIFNYITDNWTTLGPILEKWLTRAIENNEEAWIIKRLERLQKLDEVEKLFL